MSDKKNDILEEPFYSFEAEQAVLSSIIVNNSVLEQVSEILVESDFYNLEHRLIFRAIIDLDSEYDPFDVITLSEYLHTHGLLDYTDNLRCLGELAQFSLNSKLIQIHAKIIRDNSCRREILSVLTEITQSVYSSKGLTIDALLDSAESKLYEINEKMSRSKRYLNIKDLLVKEVDRIDARYQNESSYTGLITGFDDFDDMTLGLQKSDLIVIAGRPSMGKTSFALNIVENIVVNHKKPVAFFSLAEPSENIVRRLIASLSKIDLQRLRNGQLGDAEMTNLSHAVSVLNETPIIIDDTSTLNPIEIRSRVRHMIREQPLSMIVIDNLQLIESAKGKGENRAAESIEIVRSLKGLAKELGVPVLLLSQLDRSLEIRPNKRPVMADLIECSEMEENLDLVVFTYRDQIYNELSPEKGTTEIIVGKNKNGPVGMIRLAFLEKYAHFENPTYSSNKE